MMQAKFSLARLITILLCSTFALSGNASSETLSPITVYQLNLLRSTVDKGTEGFWADVAYKNYLIGLFDGVSVLDGSESSSSGEYYFCLTDQFKEGNVIDVYDRFQSELSVALRGADQSDWVVVVFVAHLHHSFPCPG